MFSVLLNVIAPVIICIGIGYCWGRCNLPYATEFVTRLITTVGAPCLIVSTIDTADLDWASFLMMAKLTVLLLMGLLVVGVVILKSFKMDVRSLILPVLVPNVGNMGLPLCIFAFGQQGLALGLIVFVITSLLHFTSADVILSHKVNFKSRLLSVLTQPLVYAAVISVVLIITGWQLPVAIANSTRLLGGFTIPLMLMTLGVSLVQLKGGNWFEGWVIALTRLLSGLTVAVSIVWLFGVTGLAAKVLILQAAMPSAIFNYLFALKYNRQADTVASGVMISTLLSFLVIPALLFFLMSR